MTPRSATKLPHPGARRFDAAIALVREGRVDEAREALFKLLQQFPASPTCAEARRIIGEMNMDALYRMDKSGGKLDYIVQPGGSLFGIVAKTKTTLEALARINSLTSTALQPGDHLFVIPMDFDVAVDVSTKSVTILRAGRYFKEYAALSINLPPGLKIPSELKFTSKSAIDQETGKAANPVTAGYVTAEKRLIASKNTTAAPLMLRGPVVPDPKAVAKKATDPEPVAPMGVFMDPTDLEELYPLLRNGAKLMLVQ
jgi:LysM domain